MIGRMLGKLPPRHDPRTLKLTDYLTPALPKPPASRDWAKIVKQPWGMMLNDRLGCCTVAALGHGIEGWTANAGSEIIVPDSAILAAYSAITGYDPKRPDTDRGAVMLDVLNYWRKTGLGGHQIEGYAALDGTQVETKQAINLFGGVDLGLNLPEFCLHTDNWTYKRGAAIAGGHAVWALTYGRAGVALISWGKLIRATWGFLSHQCAEAYAALSRDWLAAKGISPSGFNLAQLQADVAAI